MKRAIGIFDSGVGGLTVYKAIRNTFPNEDIIYFGDTARVPFYVLIQNLLIPLLTIPCRMPVFCSSRE